ncbi:hypothetical protein BGZ63DRAFT_427658 [Mariannaea sp. PMI_226]|nr:hypothetical protein BGZ63DRAFT_427658 [Mariannaea sp. PMI_226]
MSVGIPYSPLLLLPSPVHGSRHRKAFQPPTGIALPKLRPLIDNFPCPQSGLRTPPVDDMSTAFQPTLASYDGHTMHSYPAAMAQTARAKHVLGDSGSAQYYHRYPNQQHQQQQHTLQIPSAASQPSNSSLSSVTQASSVSRLATGPSTPASGSIASVQSEGPISRRGSETLIYHSLQIPKCIAPTGGNLADFAAQMTCLFWFESIEGLNQAMSVRSMSSAQVPQLPKLAKPFDQFRKWVLNVLSTTQVTQNVILLALLFIYRLKMSTPQIKGRAGSEYRLLTVALMLGNKFLDDNTYTNKTWAEVSCFPVHEIHVMEVEFLGNMRYNLYATKDQWEEWLDKLACFHEYYERATRFPTSPVHVPSPAGNVYHSPIPSPTSTMHPAVNMPIVSSNLANLSPTSIHSQNWNAYQTNTVSPLATKPAIQFPVSRKRSPEGDVVDHPAKRPAPSRAPQIIPIPVVTARQNAHPEGSRLPVPRLTLVTDQTQPVQAYANSNGYQKAQTSQPMVQTPQGHVSLPPLQPGVRAMTTVYQQSTPSTMAQQPTLPVTTGVTMGPTSFTAHAPVNYGTPGKHHSPGSLGHFNSSPLVEHFGQASAVPAPMVHTPISHSPSVYLQQRPSPYKPIRHVNTLLYPPPSTSLDQYHLSVPVPPNQMHYQPLGRRNDLRTGIVPEFLVFNRQHQQVPSQSLGSYPN